MKKYLSRFIALTTMFAMLMVFVPDPVSAATVEVGIFGNGGKMTITAHGQTFTTPDTSETSSSGTTLKAMSYTKVSVKHPKGYKLLGWHPYVNTGNGWKRLSGAKLLSTSEMLSYKLPARDVVFYAQWNMTPDYEEGIRVYIVGNNSKLKVTMNGKTKSEYSFEGGSEPGSSLKKAGFTKIATPKHEEGFVFEGWTAYKAVSNGWKVIKGAECLTTTKMLNYSFPKQDIQFLVKWRGQPNTDQLGGDEPPEVIFNIQAEDGRFKVTEADGSTFKTSGCGRGGPKGATIRDTGYVSISKPVHKNGKAFLGWRVYKLSKKGQPVRLKSYGTLSTKELLNFRLKDYDVLFMARWGCAHNQKLIASKKATLSKDGYRKLKCGKCGKIETVKIEKPKTITLSYEKTTYNGSAKKPAVIVKDDKGSKISSKYYTVKYAKGRTAVGRYKVTVTFKDRYKGSKVRYFTIVPKAPAVASATLVGTNTVKFSWEKAKGASGYKVYYKKATQTKYTYLTKTAKRYVKKSDLSEGTKYTFKVVPYYKKSDNIYASLKSKTASVMIPLPEEETPEPVTE